MLISKFNNLNVNQYLQSIEDKFDIHFPEDYKVFIRKYNGGFTPVTTFSIKKISSDLVGFYGFGDVPMNFEELGDEFISELVNNFQSFPIAKDSLGNYIVLSLNEEGAIYFYDHEDESHLRKLTTNLKVFISKCKSGTIPDIATKTVEERKAILTAKGRGHVINDFLITQWQKEYEKYSGMVQEKVEL